jgi:hypothetical protein
MELAGRTPKELPVRSNQVNLQSHQLTAIHISNNHPGHLDYFASRLMSCDTRCGVVTPLVLATASTTQAGQPGTETGTDAYIDQFPAAMASQPVNPSSRRNVRGFGAVQPKPG